MALRADIENAILESLGNPDVGVVRDNLATMVDAVMRVVNPETKSNFTNDKETRVMAVEETR